MIDLLPKDLSVREVFGYLLGGVGPRPIALVSTVSTDGNVNLSPFSFFNAFGANPPTVAFSPSRRARDNTLKDTYNNLIATRECTIQSVTYDMVQQVSLASTEYAADIDEFVKSGLTPVASDLVIPPRVKESPFQMECMLSDMIHLGEAEGSGNLAICEVVKFHISEDIFEDGVIHPNRIDLVARMSADFYCRASGSAIFEVEKPIGRTGIGYDQLPDFIKNSNILSANNLGQLANSEATPDAEEVRHFVQGITILADDNRRFDEYKSQGDYKGMFRAAIASFESDNSGALRQIQLAARYALRAGNVSFAWNVLLHAHSLEE